MVGAAGHLRDFSAALRSGNARAALAAARDACLAEPNLAEAHYAFGQAWTAAGEPARAEQAFAIAIKLRPNFPDAWVNLGLARYAQGAVEHAKRAMLGALQAQPGHPAATANLAVLLRLTGEYEAAEKLLREALARNPHDAGARLNLVAEALQEERAADALALLNEVDPPAADAAAARHWHLQRAQALLALGRPDKARTALGEFDALGPAPPELAPAQLWATALIALAEGRRRSATAAAEAAEAALGAMGPGAMLEHRIMAHYDLAKFWSRLGEDARAFALWRGGHALLKAIQPFSCETTRAYDDAAIATFTPERYAQGPRAGDADPAPVFIVGMPRSGTTLAEQIIGAHPQAHAAGERSALGRLAWRLGGGETAESVARVAAMDRAALDAEAQAYLAELHALAPDKARIVDKMPGNYAHVWLIALLFPGARIIHCTRDPRDIGYSIFTFRFYGTHGYAHDLADLGWMIGEQDRLMRHWQQALPLPILTLRLDDWIADFDATLARVLGFLDLRPDPACARFYEADSRVRTVSRSQVRQPVNASGLGRWRRAAQDLAPLLIELERAGALDGWDTAAQTATPPRTTRNRRREPRPSAESLQS
ncbi:MAG TPA: sulfotransferase [Acetobacteraceae bacterium]|nr:sulfotransferase [Acetobacteraceae bacterium]